MILRSELNQVMRAVSDAKRNSPLEVTQAGVQAFDFIAKRGGSLIATMDAFDRLYREHYAKAEAAPEVGNG